MVDTDVAAVVTDFPKVSEQVNGRMQWEKDWVDWTGSASHEPANCGMDVIMYSQL
jgi:hypothetical protein